MAQLRTYKNSQRGFSFVEVLCGVFLVTCCAAIVAASMPISTVGRTKSRYLNLAAGIAQREMEAIRGSGYANISAASLVTKGLLDSATEVATTTYTFTAVDTASGDQASLVLPSGTGKVKIEQADTDLKRVTVTVSWAERGNTRSYQIGTLVANL